MKFTILERIEILEKIGGYDVIHGLKLTRNPLEDCVDVRFNASEYEESIYNVEKTFPIIQYGVVIRLYGDCNFQESIESCAFTPCKRKPGECFKNWYLGKNVLYTPLNIMIYESLSKSIGCENNVNVVVTQLKDIYEYQLSNTICLVTDTLYVDGCVKHVYTSLHTQWLFEIYNIRTKYYSFTDFIKSCFTRAYYKTLGIVQKI